MSIGRQGQSGTVTLGAERGNARRRGWLRARGGGLWQVPVLGAGAILLVAGAATAFLTKPGPDHRPAVERAARLVERERWVEAIETLNTEVYPYLENGTLPRDVARGYHQLLARAIAGGQHELDVRSAVNDQNVISQFLEAERLDASLTPLDVALLAESYIALGRYEEAEQRVATIPDTYPEIRERLVRDMIETKLGLEQPLYTDALEALGRVLAETTISDQQRLWALARQAEVRLELGLEDEAVTSLLRELPLLQEADPAAVGELYMWLGRAYFRLDALEEAERQLRRADRDQMLPDSDERRAMARLYLAHIEARRATGPDGLERARDGYANLVERSGATAAFLPALMGMGEMEAALDNPRGSIDAYQALVQERESREGVRHPTREEIARSLLGRFEERAAAGDVSFALDYATIAGELFPLVETPSDVLLALGRSHAAMADFVLGERAQGLRLRDLTELDPGTLQQAKRHLIRAAGYYRAHADRFIIDDYELYADSLWTSAQLSDRAGDAASAIASFGEFAETVRDDPRRAEARYRLAQSHQSRGSYQTAAELYRGLIADRENAARDGVGQWADRSSVPLAQCLLLDGQPENDAEAERILLTAVNGTRGGPDRPEFRDALFELGRVFEKAGRYDLAIERLTELLERAPEDPRAAAARFRLAESYRLLSREIGVRLDETMRESQARQLRAERREHLRSAIDLYERVRDELASKPNAYRSALEDVQLRNAHFYLGDCAFDLGEYDRAIAYYSAARNRYPRDPAVLVALVQIVNAYVELGDLRSARTANERARDFYSSLPDEVWNDPNLPMGRKEWERWLESSAKLYDDLAAAG